ncbi:MAG TPA: prepilin-type N-terminal cleavage/methylation domain-containing protein [Gemmatimonadaceae bacterium]|nr:prepilin-type N-terminal cleavage/methylation domain-containing protein [Gemmatimonadaceae bacterium]
MPSQRRRRRNLRRNLRRSMRRRTARRRAGFTLVELLVALALFGIVAGAIINLVARQQRFYRGATEMIDTRTQLRQAASVLPTDIRGLSSISGDISLMTDTAVQFIGIFGSAIICGRPAGGSPIVYITPPDLARHTLTSWYRPPNKLGDIAFLFDEKVDTSAVDDDWTANQIAQAPAPLAGACAGSPLFDATLDAGKTGWAMTLGNGVPTTVKDGAAVRFGRIVRYSVYKSLSDNKWYLGYRNCGSTACNVAVEPIAGPYRDWTSGGNTNGLGFTYYDSTGARISPSNNASDMARIARIDVNMRGAGTEVKNAASYNAKAGNTVFTDSLTLRIAIRNRN